MSSQWLTCHRYNMAYVAYGFAICGHRGSVDYRPPLQPVSQAADRTLEPELWGATADDRCDGSFLNGKPLHKWISMIHFGRGNHMLFLLGFGNYIYRNMNWTSKNRRRHSPGALLYIYIWFISEFDILGLPFSPGRFQAQNWDGANSLQFHRAWAPQTARNEWSIRKSGYRYL